MSEGVNLQQVAQRGIELCREGDWERGAMFLRKAASDVGQPSLLPDGFYSYLGYSLSKLDGQHKEAIELCKKAIELQFYCADNYLNLARIYYSLGHRDPAFKALKKGLSLDPRNPGLLELRSRFPRRRAPVLGFLKRRSLFNRVLGKIRHDASGGKSSR